ncbi:MAG: 2,3-diphosphoglycerate-dependent phosphoglycerate mutase [Eubacterium aggregans]|uniref:2,3-diphosphoglycerate-dependent phosphoglycerate mutase n=1 Tax=Eubacterium aggregans TaxID=81409 RepID=UPI002B1F98A8|nr:2,3-diphosphoglycerate-dependent phosphoglycerate mutase [Eubacterium aggregans]MEA5074150.1 2,3-diphosphoglycerate-dependent phosphoglycerate mutase [Eubacterium aggregans]
MKLVLVRHGQSIWNKENLFTGWTDVDLTEEGWQEATQAGELLRNEGFDFDGCYTSYLKRAVHTLDAILTELDRVWLPVEKAWELNERHYGALQGLNKAETAQIYGEDQVKIWRRSYDVKPPLLDIDDVRCPRIQEQYRNVQSIDLPLGESLEDTIARVVPYYCDVILPQMQEGKRIIIVAHGNSLRALVKYLDKMSPEEIVEVNIPTGIPLIYDLSADGDVLKKGYLGDPKALKAKMEQIAAQGKVAPPK